MGVTVEERRDSESQLYCKYIATENNKIKA